MVKELISKICAEVLSPERTENKFKDLENTLIESWRTAIAHAENSENKNICRESYDVLKLFSLQIYSHEKNGDCLEHAKKLDWLFSKNLRAAALRIKYYVDNLNEEVTQPLHHLCMHIPLNKPPLPMLHTFGDGNLKYFFKNLNEFNIVLENIDILKKSIEESSWKATAVQAMIERIEEEHGKSNGIDLTSMSEKAKIRLRKIIKINERFKRPKYESAQEILKTLDQAKNSDHHLPPIILKSEDLGLPPGYYMGKLPDDDVRAAMAGHLTGCCQRIGKQGEPCAVHSITSELGCNYAIFKGKIADRKTVVHLEHDEIYVLSWTWVEPGRGICFDSIEYGTVKAKELGEDLGQNKKLSDEAVVNIFYTEFADRLLNASSEEIMKVSVGTDGQTPDEVGDHPINNAHIRLLMPHINKEEKYLDYRDSGRQRILAHREFQPYYKIHALNEKEMLEIAFKTQDQEIMIWLYLNYREYYEKVSSSSNNVTRVPAWAKLDRNSSGSELIDLIQKEPKIPYSLYHTEFRCTVLMALLRLLNELPDAFKERIYREIQADDLDCGNESSSCLIYATQKYPGDQKLIELMLSKGANPHLGDIKGNTFLHWYHFNITPLELDLELLPKLKNTYQLDFGVKNYAGETALSSLLQKSDYTGRLSNKEYILFMLSNFNGLINDSNFLHYFNPDIQTLKMVIDQYQYSLDNLLNKEIYYENEIENIAYILQQGGKPKDPENLLKCIILYRSAPKVLQILIDRGISNYDQIAEIVCGSPYPPPHTCKEFLFRYYKDTGSLEHLYKLFYPLSMIFVRNIQGFDINILKTAFSRLEDNQDYIDSIIESLVKYVDDEGLNFEFWISNFNISARAILDEYLESRASSTLNGKITAVLLKAGARPLEWRQFSERVYNSVYPVPALRYLLEQGHISKPELHKLALVNIGHLDRELVTFLLEAGLDLNDTSLRLPNSCRSLSHMIIFHMETDMLHLDWINAMSIDLSLDLDLEDGSKLYDLLFKKWYLATTRSRGRYGNAAEVTTVFKNIMDDIKDTTTLRSRISRLTDSGIKNNFFYHPIQLEDGIDKLLHSMPFLRQAMTAKLSELYQTVNGPERKKIYVLLTTFSYFHLIPEAVIKDILRDTYPCPDSSFLSYFARTARNAENISKEYMDYLIPIIKHAFKTNKLSLNETRFFLTEFIHTEQQLVSVLESMSTYQIEIFLTKDIGHRIDELTSGPGHHVFDRSLVAFLIRSAMDPYLDPSSFIKYLDLLPGVLKSMNESFFHDDLLALIRSESLDKLEDTRRASHLRTTIESCYTQVTHTAKPVLLSQSSSARVDQSSVNAIKQMFCSVQ